MARIAEQLERILTLTDRAERQQALLDVARSLHISPAGARRPDGWYNEEQLVVMIYEAVRSNRRSVQSHVTFLVGAVLLLAVGASVITVGSRIIRSRLGEKPAKIRGLVVQTVDKNGRPILENGEPVYYALKDGVYTEYYPTGEVKAKYTYADGHLVGETDFSRAGKVIRRRSFTGER